MSGTVANTACVFFFLPRTAACSEAHDRTSITLPGLQEELMKQIKGNVTKAHLVVALMSGGVVDMTWAKVGVFITAHTHLPTNWHKAAQFNIEDGHNMYIVHTHMYTVLKI